MPSIKGWLLIDSKRELCWTWHWYEVQTITTSPLKKSAPRVLIPNEEESRVNFKEYIVIQRELMNGHEVLGCFRNMQDIA
jgi:hypothetical protein